MTISRSASDPKEAFSAKFSNPAPSHKVGVVLLNLALPGCDAGPTGVLLLDFTADRLYCEIHCRVDDQDASDVLGCLAEEFIALSKEGSGRVVLEYQQK